MGGVQLRAGDEVAFVLHTHTKTGELNAQRVSRTKEAPEGFQLPGKELAACLLAWRLSAAGSS